MNFNQFLNERWKPLGLSIEETEKVAKDLAAALAKVDGVKFEITKGSLEPDAFDLDRDGVKWDGGSYTINSDKTIVNNAVPGGPIYGKVGDSIDKMVKTIKSVTESFLDAYDKDSEELDESIVNERNITIKRHYTDKNPAVTVGKAAKIRNRMLEAIKDGKISQEEFNTILKEMTTDSKRWLRRNAQCFNVSEDGISLSKTGSRILKNIIVLESKSETGLMVIGRTSRDNNKIGDIIDDLELHAEWNHREGYWLFPEEEDGYDELEMTLDKAFSKAGINARFEGIFEATTKAPKIWVPGGFDKEIQKYPNNKITRKIVLDAAVKWDVNPEDAIKYVEYSWAIKLKENKNTIKTKFIHESFQEFVKTKLNESKEASRGFKYLKKLKQNTLR